MAGRAEILIRRPQSNNYQKKLKLKYKDKGEKLVLNIAASVVVNAFNKYLPL